MGVPDQIGEHLRLPSHVGHDDGDGHGGRPTLDRPHRLDGERQRSAAHKSRAPECSVTRIEMHGHGQEPEQQRPEIEEGVVHPLRRQGPDTHQGRLPGEDPVGTDRDHGVVTDGSPTIGEVDECRHQHHGPHQPVAPESECRRHPLDRLARNRRCGPSGRLRSGNRVDRRDRRAGAYRHGHTREVVRRTRPSANPCAASRLRPGRHRPLATDWSNRIVSTVLGASAEVRILHSAKYPGVVDRGTTERNCLTWSQRDEWPLASRRRSASRVPVS